MRDGSFLAIGEHQAPSAFTSSTNPQVRADATSASSADLPGNTLSCQLGAAGPIGWRAGRRPRRGCRPGCPRLAPSSSTAGLVAPSRSTRGSATQPGPWRESSASLSGPRTAQDASPRGWPDTALSWRCTRHQTGDGARSGPRKEGSHRPERRPRRVAYFTSGLPWGSTVVSLVHSTRRRAGPGVAGPVEAVVPTCCPSSCTEGARQRACCRTRREGTEGFSTPWSPQPARVARTGGQASRASRREVPLHRSPQAGRADCGK